MSETRPEGEGSARVRGGPREVLARELSELERERGYAEERLREAKETLAETQQTVSEASRQHSEAVNKTAPVERVIGDLKAAEVPPEARQAAEQDVAGAEAFLAKLYRTVPEDRRLAVENAVEAVDGPIGDLRREVAGQQQVVDEAATALSEAQRLVATLEAELRERMARLRQLPADLQAARGQVSRRTTEAGNALQAGRTADAVYLAGELKRALEQLRALAAPQTETDLSDSVAEKWIALRAAKETLAAKSGPLEDAKRKLAQTNEELRARTKQRDAELRAKLNAFDAGDKPSAGRPAEPPVDARRGRRPTRG